MKLIVGLGNPGDAYNQTPHNAGFEVVDLIAKQIGAVFSKRPKNNALWAKGKLNEQDVKSPSATRFHPRHGILRVCGCSSPHRHPWSL